MKKRASLRSVARLCASITRATHEPRATHALLESMNDWLLPMNNGDESQATSARFEAPCPQAIRPITSTEISHYMCCSYQPKSGQLHWRRGSFSRYLSTRQSSTQSLLRRPAIQHKSQHASADTTSIKLPPSIFSTYFSLRARQPQTS